MFQSPKKAPVLQLKAKWNNFREILSNGYQPPPKRLRQNRRRPHGPPPNKPP